MWGKKLVLRIYVEFFQSMRLKLNQEMRKGYELAIRRRKKCMVHKHKKMINSIREVQVKTEKMKDRFIVLQIDKNFKVLQWLELTVPPSCLASGCGNWATLEVSCHS